MEQKRKSRDRPAHMAHLTEKNSGAIVQYGKDGVPESIELHVKSKTVKLQEENTGECLMTSGRQRKFFQ